MKVKLNRDSEVVETKIMFIEIGNIRYRLSHLDNDKLIINKVDLSGDDYLNVQPRSGNEISVN